MEDNSSDQFENISDHIVSVALRDPITGRGVGFPIQPGGRIWLTKQEQKMTAQAPRLEEDNILSNGAMKLVAEETGSSDRPTRPTPAAPEGSLAPEEEVGTPIATVVANAAYSNVDDPHSGPPIVAPSEDGMRPARKKPGPKPGTRRVATKPTTTE